MSSCKDCYHFKACNHWLLKDKKYLDSVEGFICKHFKKRSEIIELPCSIDSICAIRRKNYIGKEVHEKARLKNVLIVAQNENGELYVPLKNVFTIEAMLNLEVNKKEFEENLKTLLENRGCDLSEYLKFIKPDDQLETKFCAGYKQGYLELIDDIINLIDCGYFSE